MINKIYQGESLDLVFRCKNQQGEIVDLEDAQISVLLNNSFGETIHRFNTQPLGGVREITVDSGYIICHLDKESMSTLSGPHALEVKITKDGQVMIDQVRGIKIYPSVIGEETGL